jgi:predicted metalloprotease with PDZ domain
LPGLHGSTIDAIARGGYQLVYDDKPEAPRIAGGPVDLSYSVGMVVAAKGRIANVGWRGPAFAAGLIPGATIRVVPSHVERTVRQTRCDNQPFACAFENVNTFKHLN